MGKGSTYRRYNGETFRANYDRIFRSGANKPLKTNDGTQKPHESLHQGCEHDTKSSQILPSVDETDK